MQPGQEIAKHCRYGDDVENSLRRSNRCAEDNTGTALRTYMSVLILLASVIAYVIGIAPAVEITKVLTHFWLGLRKI